MHASPASPSPDLSVRELESIRPRLRTGLRIRPEPVRGRPGYLLEDPARGRFFRLGEREYRFARALDGRRSIGEILAGLASSGAQEGQALPLHEQEAATLFRSLADAGLLDRGDSHHLSRLAQNQSEKADPERLLGQAGNLLCLRVPLGNPDRFFTWLARRAGWVTAPWFLLLWFLVVALSGAAVAQQWDRFTSELTGVFQVGNLWLLALTGVALKLWHEAWHGLVCRRYGGEVPEMGMALLLLVTPLGYVNATSSLRFPSRWQRIHVAAAGMLGEIFLAALAALCWARLDPGTLWSSALHQVVVVAGFSTILFNANPLLRYDGYYILSELLQQPNLATRGQQMVSWLTRRFLLGFRDAPLPLWQGESLLLVTAYGCAAGVWRLVVTAGLLAAAPRLFHGAGLALAGAAGAALLVRQVRTLAQAAAQAPAHGSSPWKIGARLALGTSLAASALWLVAWEPIVSAPAVVQSLSGGEVRAGCPGFLRSCPVVPGERVRKGQTLATLENPEQTTALRRAEIEVALSRQRRDAFLAEENLSGYQAEAQNLSALEQKLSQLQERLSGLSLRAPRDGIVVARDLSSLAGTWLQTGHLLLTVADPDTRELLVLAPQAEVEAFRGAQSGNRPARFHPRSRAGAFPVTISRVAPSATVHPLHFALITPFQGPLAVRRTGPAAATAADPSTSGLDGFELTQPCFELRALLSSRSCPWFADGEVGRITVPRGSRLSLGERLSRAVTRWLSGLEQASARQ